MLITDYPLAKQLHADRTAQLASLGGPMRRPRLPRVSWFRRRGLHRDAVQAAPCLATPC